MNSIHNFKKIALATLGFIVLFVIGLSFFAATQVRDIIAKPITDLETVTKDISKGQDYSLRAVKQGRDEVGNLVDAAAVEEGGVCTLGMTEVGAAGGQTRPAVRETIA